MNANAKLAEKLGITEFELEWVTDFIARNEPGLFRFTNRQQEVLVIYYGYINAK